MADIVTAEIFRNEKGDPTSQYYNTTTTPPEFQPAQGNNGAVYVDVKTSVLPAGASTSVKQDSIISYVDGIEGALATLIAKDFATQTTLAALLAKVIAAPATEATSAAILAKIIASPATEATLASIKDTSGIKKITDALPAGSAILGKVGIDQTAGQNIVLLGAGTSNIGDVDVLTLPSLVAGSALIGKVGIDQTSDAVTNRTVSKISQIAGENIVSVSSLPSATWTITQDSSANTAQTLTKTAVAGQKHYITSIEVVISGAVVGASDVNILLKDGSTTKWKQIIGTTSARGTRVTIDFANPIQMSVNSTCTLNIDAAGASCITTGNIAGFTQ